MQHILDECRWLYNHLLEQRKCAWEERRESLTYYDQNATLPLLKGGRPSLVEDLPVNRLVHNRCLAKSIGDAAWAQFTGYLAYKAAWAGGQVVRVSPAYTSQDCSGCGHRQRLALADRTYRCPCCDLVLDRDHNASLNILVLGLQGIGARP